jgi:hypothetical protein
MITILSDDDDHHHNRLRRDLAAERRQDVAKGCPEGAQHVSPTPWERNPNNRLKP